MSQNYEPVSASGSDVTTIDDPSTLDTAKHEATELKDTAVGQAKDVAATVKDEASVVLDEAKSQAKDLYVQTQRELKDQANIQQQRVAAGLKSVGSELQSMSQSSENPGVATDLVRQLSGRLSGAATWLGDRDPDSLLAEVKSYARRKPGTFILGAAIAGVLIGRLTRALAANAADDADRRPSSGTRDDALDGNAAARLGSGTRAVDSQWSSGAAAPNSTVAEADTPVYAQAGKLEDGFSEDGRDVRSDSF